jgi:hypothetical protein
MVWSRWGSSLDPRAFHVAVISRTRLLRTSLALHVGGLLCDLQA